MVLQNMFRVGIVLLVLSTLSLGASAVMEYNQPEQADYTPGLPAFTVVSADTITRIVPVADVVVPVPSQPQSPSAGKEPPIIISSNSIGGSSLTVSEMKIVMGGGRNYDPETRTWGFREPFTGQKRNSFMLSWEAKRVKYGASGLPDGLKYSKE